MAKEDPSTTHGGHSEQSEESKETRLNVQVFEKMYKFLRI